MKAPLKPHHLFLKAQLDNNEFGSWPKWNKAVIKCKVARLSFYFMRSWMASILP